jgi:hypothetical protein
VKVIEWLLDSDPAIRWQVMRDLTDAPVDEVAAERAKVATEGWGTRLLAVQATDGRSQGLPFAGTGAYWSAWHLTPRGRRIIQSSEIR